MAPLRKKLHFVVHDAGKMDTNLLDERILPQDAILAEFDGTTVREREFRWFLRDVLPAHQRIAAFSRPGARQQFVRSFLDRHLLAAVARREGLDQTASFARERHRAQRDLLVEFLLKHDRVGPFSREKSGIELDEYRRQIRKNVGLRPCQ